MSHVEMMRLAESVALQSVCKRAQVGAALWSPDGDRYVGFNHRAPMYFKNPKTACLCCEDYTGKTHPDVVHAEDDAIFSALTYHEDLSEMVLYVTRQPCLLCSQLIVEHGIKSVYYRDVDDKMDGLHWLRLCGISVFNEWIDDQPQAVLERVQRTWADRWQEQRP